MVQYIIMLQGGAHQLQKEVCVSDESRVFEFENQEWSDSLQYIIDNEPPQRVQEILSLLQAKAQQHGVSFYCPGNTPYINTIPRNRSSPIPVAARLSGG